jgi:hypothetical protein
VKANSRVSLAGLLATGLAGAVGALLHLVGPDWPLRGAFLLFVIGAGLAFAMPHQVDLAKGEERAVLHADAPPGSAGKVGLRTVGPSVVLALGAEGTLRGLFGFLTFFLAFLVREHPIGGLAPTLSLGLVAAALGLGNTLGTVLGAWMRTRAPETLVTLMLAVALGSALAATIAYGAVTVVVLAFVAGLTQCLGKVALDALIQRDVPETVRTSAFARSETLMQLTWVLGGGLGIVLPLVGQVGMATASGLLAIAVLWAVRARFTLRTRRTSTAPDVA